MMIFELVPLLVVAILVAGAIYAVVAWRRRVAVDDPGIGTVRRLYFYTVAFVALMMAANGLVQVAQFVLEVSPSSTRLAIGASLVIVGAPLWALHWIMVQRHTTRLPVERRSVVRKFYLYVVLGVAVGLATASSVGVLQWIFGSPRFSGYHWAAVIVWSVVWAFHWRVEEAESQPTTETRGIRRLYLYLVSLATLVMVAVGFGRVIHIILLEGYQSVVSLPVLLPAEHGLWRPSTRAGLSLALAGVAVWGSHWLYLARGDFGSSLRLVYLYIFAILGGALTVLVSLGFIINGALAWSIGVPMKESTATHFSFLPGALASLSVGVALWTYHWTVVRTEAEASPNESEGVRRTYAYIMAALGLGALVVAIGTLVNTAVAILAESAPALLAGQDLWREPVALGITLVILGAPLWGYYWTSIQRRVGAAGERTALSRRIFIFAALGAGALAVLGSVSFLIFVFLRGLLEGDLSLGAVREAKTSFAVIGAAVVFLPYYWLVYRQDRQAQPEDAPPERELRRIKEVSVLVYEGGDAFVRDLEAELGYLVSALRLADPGGAMPVLDEAQYQELAGRIIDAAGQSVLVVPDGATVRVLSYYSNRGSSPF